MNTFILTMYWLSLPLLAIVGVVTYVCWRRAKDRRNACESEEEKRRAQAVQKWSTHGHATGRVIYAPGPSKIIRTAGVSNVPAETYKRRHYEDDVPPTRPFTSADVWPSTPPESHVSREMPAFESGGGSSGGAGASGGWESSSGSSSSSSSSDSSSSSSSSSSDSGSSSSGGGGDS